jgi:glucosamine-6-phosphate deaminase
MAQKRTVEVINFGSLKIQIYDTSRELGKASADMVISRLEEVIREDGHANLLLATGASQLEFLKAFRKTDQLDWSKITTFHLDEYIGIDEDHPASFRKYLHDRIIDEVKPGKSFFLQGDADDIPDEIERYEQLLRNHPIDVACIGIGENGHLAFNDPPVADFEDPRLVKVVELDQKSRQQQVDEGWFDSLEEVPTHALSLTIPAIMDSKTISCVVPDKRKADAVFKALNGPISTDCPASALRNHPDATLFLDAQSASRLKKETERNKDFGAK